VIPIHRIRAHRRHTSGGWGRADRTSPARSRPHHHLPSRVAEVSRNARRCPGHGRERLDLPSPLESPERKRDGRRALAQGHPAGLPSPPEPPLAGAVWREHGPRSDPPLGCGKGYFMSRSQSGELRRSQSGWTLLDRLVGNRSASRPGDGKVIIWVLKHLVWDRDPPSISLIDRA
jgi:hypothetical protein